jgi:SAM-dependent MidA family methyltransferase
MPLPSPTPDAAQNSALLSAHIVRDIETAGGWIPFSRYMELALTTPGLGYYCSGGLPFGAGGDFVTAPQMSPLFAQTLATPLAQVMSQSAMQVIEAGAGTGLLAAELLLEFERLNALPIHYHILEISEILKACQRETLLKKAPHLIDRVRWLERLPDHFEGVVIGNEVLDALPTERVSWLEGDPDSPENIVCEGVIHEAGVFRWQARPAEGALRAAARALADQLPRPYTSEIPLCAQDWVRAWGSILIRGAVLLIDYGFPRHEFYHPLRNRGTLMCHYRHHAHDDPFHWPGLTDITTHIDFTALTDAALSRGLELLGYTSQACFLLNCGLLDRLQTNPADSPRTTSERSHAVNVLLSPAEMGELFKVIAFGRALARPMIGFEPGDRSHRL